MKQVVLQGGRAEVIDVPAPLASAGGVLVQVAYSVISTGTELANLQGTAESAVAKARRKPALAFQALQGALHDGVGITVERIRNRLSEPVATGYSCAGVITEVGAGVTDLRVGQTVACAGADCAWHAEYVAVPRLLVCPLPDGVSPRAGASAAIGAIALQGVRQAQVEIGSTVVVIGLGLVGLLTVQIARAAGAQVIGVDPVAERRSQAEQLGARTTAAPADAGLLIRELTRGLGVDRAIITAATKSSDPLRQAMDWTRKRGIVVVVGDVGLELTRSPFYEKEIDLRIACSYGPGRYDATYERGGIDYPAPYVRWTENRNMDSYLELLRAGSVSWEALASKEMDVADAAGAFESLSVPGADRPLAVMLRFSGSTETPPRRSIALPPRPVARGIVRLGVIGAGAFARAVHLPHLKRMRERFAVTGIASRTAVHAHAAAREIGATFCTTDYHELLERPDVDAVLIATRHDQHAGLAMAALDAGKAVFLEKPVAVTQPQLDALLTRVEAVGLPFLVGFNRRFSTSQRFLADRISQRAESGAVVINYRVNADPGGAADWSHGAEGGGRAVGEACHMVDFLYSLAGEGPVVDLQVLSLAASGERPDANFSAQLRFANGTLATLLYTTRGHRSLPKERVEVMLGGEALVVDDFRRGTVYSGAGVRLFPERVKLNKGQREEWDVFHRACVSGEPLPIALATLRAVTETTFRIREAAMR